MLSLYSLFMISVYNFLKLIIQGSLSTTQYQATYDFYHNIMLKVVTLLKKFH
jgi:hypothetical protein